LQAKRDDRRACDAPSRTHRGKQVRAKKALEGLKKQRALSITDINQAIRKVNFKAIRDGGRLRRLNPKLWTHTSQSTVQNATSVFSGNIVRIG
jgi:hypothetical protein